jgi:hypothetical protein
MDSPVTIVKTAIQPSSIIRVLVGTVLAFALLDLLGVTSSFLYPVTALRNKFAKPSGS